MAIDWDRAVEIESGELQQTITVMDEDTVNVSAGKVILYVHGDGGGGGGGGEAVWGSITGTLSSQADLQNALNAKANTADLGDLAALDSIDYASAYLTNKPTLGALSAKNTADYATDVTNKPTLGTMSAVNDAASDSKTYGRKNGSWVEVTGGGGGSTDWDDITNKPSTFPPESHTHDDRYYTEAETDALLEDKTDLSVIAPAFSASTAYSAGEMVIYDEKLYYFSSAHPAGAWTGTDAYEVKVAHVLQAKQDVLTFDTTPTANSTRPVTSGGIKTYVDSHDDFKISGSVSSGGYTLTDYRIDSEHWEVDWIIFETLANVRTDVSWSTDITNHTVTLSATYAGATNVIVNLHWVQ